MYTYDAAFGFEKRLCVDSAQGYVEQRLVDKQGLSALLRARTPAYQLHCTKQRQCWVTQKRSNLKLQYLNVRDHLGIESAPSCS